jgi:DNA-binding transcriptional regulator YiaG
MNTQHTITADTVRAWRRTAGLSAAAAAKLCYVSPRTWLRWEAGDGPLSRAHFELAQLKHRRKPA